MLTVTDWIALARAHFAGHTVFVVPWPYARGVLRVDGVYLPLPDSVYAAQIAEWAAAPVPEPRGIGYAQTVCRSALRAHGGSLATFPLPAPDPSMGGHFWATDAAWRTDQPPQDYSPELRRALRLLMDSARTPVETRAQLALQLADQLRPLNAIALRKREASPALYALANGLAYALSDVPVVYAADHGLLETASH